MTHGKVLAVNQEVVGSWLASGIVAGATTIPVQDLAPFDDDGGSLEVSDGVNIETDISYTGLDYDALALTGVAGVSNTYAADDTYVRPRPLAPYRSASVVLDNEDEAVRARVPMVMYDRLPLGFRDFTESEPVDVVFDGEEYTITDLLGTKPVVDGSYITPATLPPPTTDGNPPPLSPVPTVTGMVSSLFIRWTGIANADFVTYEVHISPTNGFTAGPTTKVGETPSTIATIRALNDGSLLAVNTTYYVRIIAKDADGSAAASAQASGQLALVTGPDITVGAITADMITAGNLLAAVVVSGYLGSDVIGAASQHWEADGAGIRLVSATGATIIELPTDVLKSAKFVGDLVAGSLETAQATFRGVSRLDVSSILDVAGKLSDPTTAPSLTQDVPLIAFNTASAEDWGYRSGLWFDGTNYVYIAYPFHQNDNLQTLVRVNTSGVEVSRTTLTMPAGFAALGCSVYGGPVRVGAFWYAIVWCNGVQPNPGWRWFRWADVAGIPSGAATDTGPQQEIVAGGPQLTTDGTDLYMVDYDLGGGGFLHFNRYTVGNPPLFVSQANTSANIKWKAGVFGYYRGNGDFGSVRNVVKLNDATNKIYVLDGTGAEQTTEEWLCPAVTSESLTYNGGFMQMAQGSKNLWAYSSFKIGAGFTTTTYWLAYTWYDSVGTVHESALSKRKSIAMNQRWRLSVTWAAIPTGAGADDPDTVRLYMKANATDPGTSFASYFLQGTSFSGLSTYLVAYSTATAGSRAAAFPGAVPGIIQSDNGEWEWRGDGTFQVYRTIPKMAHFESDLMGNAPGENFLVFAGGAGSGMTLPASPVNHPGCWDLHTGTTATGRNGLYTYNDAVPVLGNGKVRVGALLQASGNLSDATNRYQITVGLSDSDPPSGLANGVQLRYRDSLGANWQALTDKASTATTLDTGIAVAASTWYFLEIEINAAGTQADFYVNQTLVGSITTNIPIVNTRFLVVMEKLLGTADRFCRLDALYFQHEMSGARF